MITRSRSLQPQLKILKQRTMHREQRTIALCDLSNLEETASRAKSNMLVEHKNNKFIKHREKLVTEAAVAKSKAEGFKQLTIAQNEHLTHTHKHAIKSNLVRNE
jgi:hypothetical protein